MTGPGYLAPVTARQFGALAGQVSAALAAFSHPGADLPNQWDVRRSPQVVADLLGRPRPGPGRRVSRASRRSPRGPWTRSPPTCPRRSSTPTSPTSTWSADPGPDARLVPAGIIDFGDLMHTWRAAEAAVTICALLVKDPRAPLRIAEDVLARVPRPRSRSPPSRSRRCGRWSPRAPAPGWSAPPTRLRSEPDNPYLHDNLAVDRAVFEMVAALPLELGTLAMRRAAGLLGRPSRARRSGTTVLPDLGEVTPDRPVHHLAAARRGGVDRSGTRARRSAGRLQAPRARAGE